MDKQNRGNSANDSIPAGENRVPFVNDQPEVKKNKVSAADLLSRLNQNMQEMPADSRRSGMNLRAMDQYRESLRRTAAGEAPVQAAPAAEPSGPAEPAFSGPEIRPQPAEDVNGPDPMFNTFEMPEPPEENPDAVKRQVYHVAVRQRAKNSRIQNAFGPHNEAQTTVLPAAESQTPQPETTELPPAFVPGADDPQMPQLEIPELPPIQGAQTQDAPNGPEAAKPEGDKDGAIDETDINLMIAFGMEDELKKQIGKQKVDEINKKIDANGAAIDEKMVQTGEASQTEKEKPHFEFTEASQVQAIFRRYQTEFTGIVGRLLACVLLILVTFFYENAEIFGAALPAVVNPSNYPVIHVLIGLQFLLLGGMLIYRRIFSGTVSLIEMKPVPESLIAVTMLLSAVYDIVVCFFRPVSGGVRIYDFPMMVAILLVLINEFIDLKREMYSFNVAASKKPKYTIDRVTEDDAQLEREIFSEQLPESPIIFRIGRVKFVDGYFRRTEAEPAPKKEIGLILTIVTAVALLFGIAGCFLTKSLYGGMLMGYITLVIATPVSAFLVYSYPFYCASKIAYSTGGAIVGEISLQEYAKASLISFDDVDVFPSSLVRLKTVRTFGNGRIEKAVFDAKCIFTAAGGPLADVFSLATEDDVSSAGKVEFLSVADDGIEAMIGDRHLLVGKASYLQAHNFESINSREDIQLESSGDMVVMYMVEGDEVVAKFYLTYRIDPDFEFTLSQLYKADMCIGIRTLDPNINDLMLSTRIKISKYAVKVIKYHEPFPAREWRERCDSGVISKTNPKSLLTTLAMCEKVQHLSRINRIIKVASVVIAMVIMAFVLILNQESAVLSIYLALYQVFWLIPMIILSKLFL